MISLLGATRRVKLPEYDGFSVAGGDGSTFGGAFSPLEFVVTNPASGAIITLNLMLLHVNASNQWDIFEPGASFSFTASNRMSATVGTYTWDSVFNPDGPRATTGLNTVYGFIYSGTPLTYTDLGGTTSGQFSTNGPGLEGKLYELTVAIRGRSVKLKGTTIYNFTGNTGI